MRRLSMFFACSLVTVLTPLFAQSPTLQATAGASADQTIRIREEGRVKVSPDTLYLLMKVESSAAQLGQAMEQNKKAVEGFVEALGGLGISSDSIRQTNFVVTPSATGYGASFARNVVITIPSIDQKAPGEIRKLMAKAQDLGARFGSNCITCIGSG